VREFFGLGTPRSHECKLPRQETRSLQEATISRPVAHPPVIPGRSDRLHDMFDKRRVSLTTGMRKAAVRMIPPDGARREPRLKRSVTSVSEVAPSGPPSLASFNSPNWRVGRVMICLAFSFILTPLLRASPQDISVRLVDARSGKPLSKVSVEMFSWNGTWTFDPHKPFPKREELHAITDAEGRAVFHLAEPIPEHVGFLVGGVGDFSGCCCRQNFSPETVLRSGVVADYDESRCGKPKRQVSAEPGEVVILDKKLTLWQKIRRELP
jgi:hypothetical protein